MNPLPTPIVFLLLSAFGHPGWAAESPSRPVTPIPGNVAPSLHPLQRYKELWETNWFASPLEGPAQSPSTSASMDQFAYRFVGLGDWRGQRWVYLADLQGRVLELTLGQTSGDLTLVRVDENTPGPGSESPGTVAHIRQGSRMISLELVKPAAPQGRPDPKSGAPAPKPHGVSSKEWLRALLQRRTGGSSARQGE